MSPSKRAQSNQCLKVRQTMFEFLKRKKHSQLQSSLKKFSHSSSKKNHESSATKSFQKPDQHSRTKSSAVYDDFVLQDRDTIPLFSNRHNKFAHSNTITPKKISFALNDVQNFHQSSRKPFVQLISPIKNLSNLNRTSTINFTQAISKSKQKPYGSSIPTKSILKPSSSQLKDNSEPFTKRKMNSSLNSLKQTFHKMHEAGLIAKEKSNQLCICLVNLVKDAWKNNFGKENTQSEKKLGQIKHILNAIDSVLGIFTDTNQAEEIIEQFHANFTEHLNDLESANNHNFRQQLEQRIAQITGESQAQIKELDVQNNKLQRQVQKLNKKIDKMERQHQNNVQNYQERQKNMLQTIQQLKNQNQQEIQVSVDKISALQEQLDSQQAKSKSLQKQLKDYLYSSQKSVSIQVLKRNEQMIARESFLLKQIQTLKIHFTTDISQLHTLYQAKQQQFEKRIELLNQQIQREQNQRKCDRAISDRILQEANMSRSDLLKLGKNKQDMMQDLYRINEDLFQHWLALKDVKTLSQRLNIFPNFERIYLDLAFNPNLFRI